MNFKLTMPKFPGFTKILAGLLAVTMVLGSVNMTAFAVDFADRPDGVYQDGDLSGDADSNEGKTYVAFSNEEEKELWVEAEVKKYNADEDRWHWLDDGEVAFVWKYNGTEIKDDEALRVYSDSSEYYAKKVGTYTCAVTIEGEAFKTYTWEVIDGEKAEADRDAAKKEAETAKTAAETAKKDAEAAKKEVEAAKAEVAAAKKEAADAKAADTATKAKAEADLKAAQEKLAAAEAAQKKAEQKAASLEVPKKPSLKSVKAGKKKTLKVSWKKVAGVKGYEIQYATNKKFTKNVKTVKAKASKTSYTIKKLKAKKKYFVRIRGYKKVNGGTIYGKWSSVKNAKTKK